MGNAPPGRGGQGREEHAALLPREHENPNDLRQALLPSQPTAPPNPHYRATALEEKKANDDDAPRADDDEKARPYVPAPSRPLRLPPFSPSSSPSSSHRISVHPSSHSRGVSLQSSYSSSSSSTVAAPSLSPYASTEPLELWVSVFSFLSQSDLAHASSVSRRWASTAYDPTLWTSIHLCHRYHRVDDHLIALLLSSGRFPRLAYLCLDRCSAITDVSLGYVQAFCPRLEHLSLVHCHRLTTEGVLAYIQGSAVRKVELIGAMGAWDDVVMGVEDMGRDVELGFYMMEWCAKEGVKLRKGRGSAEDLMGRRHSANVIDDDFLDEEKAQPSPSGAVAAPGARLNRGASEDERAAPRPGVSAAAIVVSAAALVPVAVPAPPALPPLRVPNVVRASCRHQRSVADNPGASACWGSVSGRLVLSSAFYHVPGNYPVHVLYSCEQHSEADFSDAHYRRCQNCDQLFLPASMYSELVCRHCYDSENLARRHNWIRLTPRTIKEFGLSEVVGKTIRVAERKNLPVSLTSYKASECRLDYTLPEEYDRAGGAEEDGDDDGEGGAGDEKDALDVTEEKEEKDEQEQRRRRRRKRRALDRRRALLAANGTATPPAAAIPATFPAPATASTALLAAAPPDATRVPLTTFLSNNASRLDRTVDTIQAHLRRAYQQGCTRALLVLDDAENIEVMADSRVIADGLEGESHLKLVTLIWQKLLYLLYPLLLLFLLSAYYRDLFNRLLYEPVRYDGVIWRETYIVDEGSVIGELNNPVLWSVLGLFFVLLIALVVLFRRYRRYFEVLFKKFLAGDIFAIFAFGTITVVTASALVLGLPLDAVTLCVVVLNVAMACVYTLYYDVGVLLHTLAVVYLNAIMAILLSGALTGSLAFWLPFVLCGLVAVLDLDLRPNLRLPPLLVPESMIIPSKPTILLCIQQVYVRPGELTLYGLMVTLVGEWTVLTVMGVMGLWVLLVCVVPFVSGERRWRRPLPYMLLWCTLLYWQYDRFIGPARFRWNGLST